MAYLKDMGDIIRYMFVGMWEYITTMPREIWHEQRWILWTVLGLQVLAALIAWLIVEATR